MMVYRSLVVGLLGAIVLLVAAPRPSQRPAAHATAVEIATPSDAEATLVDVSRRIAGEDPMPLLGLHPGERVAAVDGAAATGVDLVDRWARTFPGEFLDIEVTGGGTASARRILVLVHP
jgi:hypothetical protein